MDITILVAGVISILMGAGHETIGVVWVLPGIEKNQLPATPFGPQSLTDGMVRVSWHIVTVLVIATGVVLVMLAGAEASDARTLLLRSFAVMWISATVMTYFVVRPRWSSLARLPVPFLWVLVGVLCWVGST